MTVFLLVGYKISVDDFIKSKGGIEYVNRVLKNIEDTINTISDPKANNEPSDNNLKYNVETLVISLLAYKKIAPLVASGKYKQAGDIFVAESKPFIRIAEEEDAHVFLINGLIYVCTEDIMSNPITKINIEEYLPGEYGFSAKEMMIDSARKFGVPTGEVGYVYYQIYTIKQ